MEIRLMIRPRNPYDCRGGFAHDDCRTCGQINMKFQKGQNVNGK